MPDIKGQSPRTRGTPMPQVEAQTRELAPAHKPKYARLTQSDVGVLLKLHRDGLTQTQIAQRLGCDQSAVSRWLADLTDTTDVSKSYLRGQSLRMAQNIVKKGRAADHVSALKGLGVLEEQASGGLTIVVGGTGNDVKVAVVSPASHTHPGESLQIP